MDQTLLDRAYHWERTAPDRVYLTQPMGGGRVVDFTWRRALGEARRMAAYLGSLGLPRGSRIAIVAKNSAHFLLADLAIWMAGHVSVALYPTLDRATLTYCLEHCEARLLFVGKLDTWDDLAPGVPAGLPVVTFPLAPPRAAGKAWDEIVAETPPLEGEPRRDPTELAIIFYTSGSTGRPKGVMHSLGALYGCVSLPRQGLTIDHTDRMLSYLPLAHVFERLVVEAGSLDKGFHVFFAESLDTFLQDLQRARPTLFISVPRLWLKFQSGVFGKVPKAKLDRLLRVPILSRLLKKKILRGLGLDAVRFAGSGSAPIPPDLIQWYRNLGLELLEGYGMTEDCAHSHLSLPGRSRVGYVGEALPGVEVRLSEEGEVLVKSPGNMLGYYKEPELTAACYTPDGFFRTGDRGERDELGRLKITGRVKELFKTSKGKYVAPVPIENLLNAHPMVELSCVAGLGQPQPHALVLLAEDLRKRRDDASVKASVDAALHALHESINRQLPPHEALEFLVVVREEWTIANGLLTPTLKLKRGAIEEAYASALDGWYAKRAPVIWE